MLERHRQNDEQPVEAGLEAKAAQRIERLDRQVSRIRRWLAENPQDRRGAKGGLRKSNRTDNDSAKMATSKASSRAIPVFAAVDDRNQIIVEAQAHGTGSEQETVVPRSRRWPQNYATTRW